MFTYTFTTAERRLLSEVGGFGAAPEGETTAPKGPETAPEALQTSETVNERAGEQATEEADKATKTVDSMTTVTEASTPAKLRELAGLVEETVETQEASAQVSATPTEEDITDKPEEDVEG